jgi:hypothetical protein
MYIGLNVKYLLFQKCFVKTHPVAEDLFHAEAQTEGRTEKDNDVNSPLFQFLVRH